MGVHRTKQGAKTVPAYCCAYHRERGACGNNLRRLVEGIDAAVLEALQSQCLRENTILEVLHEVRSRLARHGKRGQSEVPKLRKRIAKLNREIAKLGEAVLATDRSPTKLVEMMGEREAQVHELEAQATALETAPSVLDLEVRRIEKEARKRLEDVRTLMASNPSEVRKALEAILDGPITFTPRETAEGGKRYEIEGRR